jgi:predicted dehydrogenase
MNRRQWLQAAGVAAATTPYFWTARRAQATSANDKLRIGAIGTSIYTNRYTGSGDHPGRGAVVGHQAGQLGSMIAVADVNRRNAEFFAAEYDGNCRIYEDYRDLIARDDIDAVTIGTPDHWHAKIAIDAMRADKHVYCEKPLTLTIREGQQICKVAEETGKVCQVGTQQRSEFDNVCLHAVAIAQSGMLGDKLHCLISVGQGETGGPFQNKPAPDYLNWERWLGQAPLVPYCPERGDFDFRWWWEYSGGQVTDWGVHHGDIALWALGEHLSGPTKIAGTGNYPQIENGFNTAVDFDCHFEFASGHTARLYSGKNELIISGDRGRIRVNRGGLSGKPAEALGVAHKVGDNEFGSGVAPADAPKARRIPAWLQEAATKLCNGKQPGNHMANFFECIRDGGKPISDVWSHHRSVSLCHLANIAMRLNRPLSWDPAAEIFPHDDEATAMTTRAQRDGYQIDVEI